MRTNSTLFYKQKKKEKLLQKTEKVTQKVAVGFVAFILIALFLKMVLPSSP